MLSAGPTAISPRAATCTTGRPVRRSRGRRPDRRSGLRASLVGEISRAARRRPVPGVDPPPPTGPTVNGLHDDRHASCSRRIDQRGQRARSGHGVERRRSAEGRPCRGAGGSASTRRDRRGARLDLRRAVETAEIAFAGTTIPCCTTGGSGSATQRFGGVGRAGAVEGRTTGSRAVKLGRGRWPPVRRSAAWRRWPGARVLIVGHMSSYWAWAPVPRPAARVDRAPLRLAARLGYDLRSSDGQTRPG